MKIGKLDQHCGDCKVIEYCGDPFDYCLCSDARFEEITEEEYKELTEKIDWSDFKEHPPCVGCSNKESCDGLCEEESEQKDNLVRFIADKVEILIGR
jgi:radical SAM protein with 4Fe4S-binding SPASM domain